MARIVVVEDAAPIRRIVEAVLRDRDHEVLGFGDLASARAHLAERIPDLLVVDVLLPDGSGLDLIASLRDAHPDLPIVVTSGLHTEEDFRAGFAAGATDYIRKPFVPGELIAKCEAHLSRVSQALTRKLSRLDASEPFGRYRIDGIIGRGANGVVFRALDARSGQPVALKVLSSLTEDAETRLRFLREAYTLSSLRHEHIVSVLDFGIQDGRFYYAMPVIDGPHLRKLVKAKGPAGPEDLAALVRPIASALSEIHAKGMVHRDLSPSNILLEGESWSRPMLVDFGLAKHVFDSALTQHDVLIGTPGYLDPALLADSEPSAATDVYSLGAVAYFAATGRDAHDHLTGLAKVRAMRDRPPRLPQEVPAELRALLERTLDPVPERRPSAEAIAAALAPASA